MDDSPKELFLQHKPDLLVNAKYHICLILLRLLHIIRKAKEKEGFEHNFTFEQTHDLYLVAGIVISALAFTFLLEARTKELFVSLQQKKASHIALHISSDIRDNMIAYPHYDSISRLLTSHTLDNYVETALFKHDGSLYAGKTANTPPDDLFAAPRDLSMDSKEGLLFYKPLATTSSATVPAFWSISLATSAILIPYLEVCKPMAARRSHISPLQAARRSTRAAIPAVPRLTSAVVIVPRD